MALEIIALAPMAPLAADAVEPPAAFWLPQAEAVHRQLRPQLPADYVARMTTILAAGARLTLAVERDDAKAGPATVRGLALWRLIENTYEGRRLYVDDLVCDAACRSQGIGQRLLGWLQAEALRQDCDVLALDSGVQRAGAHHFYFREGMQISSFCFRKALK